MEEKEKISTLIQNNSKLINSNNKLVGTNEKLTTTTDRLVNLNADVLQLIKDITTKADQFQLICLEIYDTLVDKGKLNLVEQIWFDELHKIIFGSK